MSYFNRFFDQSKKTNTVETRHKNKYKKFSKAIEDRSEEEYFERLDHQEKVKSQEATLRKTTIPLPTSTTGQVRNASLTRNLTKIRDIVSDLASIDPTDPFTFGYLEIGTILVPHGVYGELKAEIEMEFVQDLANFLQNNKFKTIYIKKPDRRTPRPVQVLSARPQSSTIFLLKLKGINTRIKANLLKRYKIFLLKSDLSPLENNEFFLRDLIGLSCYVSTDRRSKERKEWWSGKAFAKVVGVVPPDELCDNPTLAKLMHSLLEIQKIGSKELCLIPFVPAIVKEVDLTEKRILLDPPVGLLDITYVAEEQKIIKGLLPPRIDSISEELRKELEMNTMITSIGFSKNDSQ